MSLVFHIFEYIYDVCFAVKLGLQQSLLLTPLLPHSYTQTTFPKYSLSKYLIGLRLNEYMKNSIKNCLSHQMANIFVINFPH